MPVIGRPRTLTPVKRAELCSLVSSGIDLDEAVAHVGCSTRTVRRHAERDAEFRSALTQAQLASRLDPVFFLRRAAEKDWRAAAWLLERTDPDAFLPRDRANCSPQELSIVVDRVVEAALRQIDDQEARARVYHHATSVARAAINELFPAATPSGPRLTEHFYPHCARESADEFLCAAGRSFDATPPGQEPVAGPSKPQGPANNPFRPGPHQPAASGAETHPAPVTTSASVDKTPASVAKTPAEFRETPAAQLCEASAVTVRLSGRRPPSFVHQPLRRLNAARIPNRRERRR